jgi:hypothetical protein
VRLLEGVAGPPGVEVLLLGPYRERDVVTEGIGVAERVDA